MQITMLIEAVQTLLKRFHRDKNGNILVGTGQRVEVPDGQAVSNVLVGQDNAVESHAKPGTTVNITGNKMFGRGNKITIR